MTHQELADKTSDAYSAAKYYSWVACVRALRKEGYTDREIEAILYSKWTRWAADRSKNPYGKASSNDLLNYIREFESEDSVKLLTKEHFDNM